MTEHCKRLWVLKVWVLKVWSLSIGHWYVYMRRWGHTVTDYCCDICDTCFDIVENEHAHM